MKTIQDVRTPFRLRFMLLTVGLSTFAIWQLAQAQQPVSFTTPTGVWHVANSFPQGSLQFPDFIATTTEVYFYEGDTVADGYTYLRLWSTPDEAFLNSTNRTLKGYVRSLGDTVFLLNLGTGMQEILYDFSLQIGDSALFTFDDIIGNIYLIVEQIDTLIIDGEQRRRLFFSEPPPMGFFFVNEVWIEGIGSLHGPLFPVNARLFDDQGVYLQDLACYFSSDEILWSHPDYNQCYLEHLNVPIGIAESETQLANRIYPNPVTDRLYIDCDRSKPTKEEIILRDALGRLADITVVEVSEQSIAIDLSLIPSGIYTVQMRHGTEFIRKQIVKP
jgi:hypothetical protein